MTRAFWSRRHAATLLLFTLLIAVQSWAQEPNQAEEKKPESGWPQNRTEDSPFDPRIIFGDQPENNVLLDAIPVEDTAPTLPESKDLLGAALRILGSERSDLGTHPNPTWTRFPHPRHIPYTLPLFEGVFSEPMRLYDLSRTMGNTVERYLGPGVLDREPQALHKLVYYLGVDKRRVGFRDYSANLPAIDETEPLLRAIESAYALAGQTLEPRSFGKTVGNSGAELQGRIESLPPELQRIVAQLLVGLVDASRWQRLAFRDVSPQALATSWNIRDLGEAQGDGVVYYPEIDDIARKLDEASLAYACMKTVQAAQDARSALKTWITNLPKKERKSIEALRFEHETPLGRILVSGSSNDQHAASNVLMLIDLGGEDLYSGAVGASASLATPISVCIDLEGKDVYKSADPGQPTQGAGVFGAGVLIDVAGNDLYEASAFSQGAGFFGLGLLLDESGEDRYRVVNSGQGCGYFGIGMCLDVQGDDDYWIRGDGQGFGGVGGGVGILADHSGRDHYMADPYAEGTEHNGSEAKKTVNVSNAQGVGKGRRGDGSDGHAWAGGLGAIIDIHGNDTYESGHWSLGSGYWFGTGVAFDGNGNDIYRSVYFSQAAGAHYANGVLVDESGHDRHILYETAGASFAFGWDYANALFLNKSGDDRYEALTTSFARADIRSTALFFDLEGDDEYQYGKGQRGMGAADYLDNYKQPDPIAPYNSETSSFGILVDIGGEDRYYEWDPERRKASPSETWGNQRRWLTPAPGDPEYGHRNHGIGMDMPVGTIPEFMRFDPEPPSPTSSR